MSSELQSVKGDVEFAIRQLIADLVEGKRSNGGMISRWDAARGNDWIISTKKHQIPLST